MRFYALSIYSNTHKIGEVLIQTLSEVLLHIHAAKAANITTSIRTIRIEKHTC
jgi:hypothetical protein